jgi:hypothetical protein
VTESAHTTGSKAEVLAALQAEGLQVLTASGGFFVKNEGFVSLASARRRTGIMAPNRKHQPRQVAWGEYATIAAITGRFNR